MSDYDKRYNVCSAMVSHYTDDPAKALRLYKAGLGARNKDYGYLYPAPYITEGSADHDDMSDGRTCVTRRTSGIVLPSTLEYIVQRAVVQDMLKEIQNA